MSKKFVNKNSLIDALFIAPSMSASTLQKFAGEASIIYAGDSITLQPANGKPVCFSCGDMLVKDSKGNIYPLPLDVFENQFICIEDEPEVEDIRIARWLGHNPNSVLIQLGGTVDITTILPDRTLLLSNGKFVPAGYYVMHNVTRDTWSVMDSRTLSMLSGGKL